jgi:ABC-type methionine transport system permease subunit
MDITLGAVVIILLLVEGVQLLGTALSRRLWARR